MQSKQNAIVSRSISINAIFGGLLKVMDNTPAKSVGQGIKQKLDWNEIPYNIDSLMGYLSIAIGIVSEIRMLVRCKNIVLFKMALKSHTNTMSRHWNGTHKLQIRYKSALSTSLALVGSFSLTFPSIAPSPSFLSITRLPTSVWSETGAHFIDELNRKSVWEREGNCALHCVRQWLRRIESDVARPVIWQHFKVKKCFSLFCSFRTIRALPVHPNGRWLVLADATEANENKICVHGQIVDRRHRREIDIEWWQKYVSNIKWSTHIRTLVFFKRIHKIERMRKWRYTSIKKTLSLTHTSQV